MTRSNSTPEDRKLLSGHMFDDLPLFQVTTTLLLQIFYFYEAVQIQQQRVVILNSYNEKLVGILHETGSKEVVIVCHGYRSCKET
ncbi:hypothetical protein QVD17_13903 [Tagetes erecta]|uniref:Uncharacterized protein n=1 Tax=Tagetes erecta TaxID=13708 RepID=A0AAD8KWI2_TARER|nr:hypothetical protein QVD17_13903 [Tagetes erecta]